MSSNTGKKYGLILSKKKETQLKVTKPSVFDSGSDSEEEDKSRRNFKKLTNMEPKLKAQLEIQKALDEDPTVYEYDSVYDAMKEKKEAKISEATVDRKPKYIQNLLKTADKRKKEYERRVERKIQKEREEEGEKFADKEAFVTSAYKKKMQELQEEEEKEKRMDAIEAMMDVTKQKDLSGFYRHLLNRETSDSGEKSTLMANIKEEKLSSGEDDDKVKNSDIHQSGTSKCSTSTSEVTTMDDSEKKARESLQQLRKGNKNSDYSKPSAKTDTLDADNDFTSDSESSSLDSSEDDQQTKRVESQSKEGRQVKRSVSPAVHKKRNNDKSEERYPRRVEKTREDSEDSSSESEQETKKKNHEKNNDEPALNDQDRLRALFAKRTVGDAFTAAKERYMQRKKLRTSGFAVTCS